MLHFNKYHNLIEKLTKPELKKLLIENIKETDDELTLEQVMAILFKEEISEIIDNILIQKNIPLKINNQLISLLMEAPGQTGEKIGFLNEILEHGIIDDTKLAIPNKLMTFNSLLNTKYEFIFNSIKDFILSWCPMISAANIGKGEMFFFLFANNTYQGTKGDLVVDGVEVELKGPLARMLSTKGYTSTNSVFENYFKPYLDDKFPGRLSPDPNYYNFNIAGIERLVDIYLEINDPEWCKNHLLETFKRLYTINDILVHRFIKETVRADGGFERYDFIRNFYEFQFDYYKSIDGFAGIQYINPKTGNLLYIQSGHDLKNNLDKFKTHLSFSWKENRNVTWQLTLK